MKKVALIVGTRPEAIKMIPLYLFIKKNKLSLQMDPILISTGQHKEMLQQIFDFFEIEADHDLKVMLKNQTLVDLAGILTTELGRLLKKIAPQAVIVQGDTTSAMIGALCGFYLQIKVAHVEAGLRTYNRLSPYPEEINRQIIGSLADIHYSPTQRATDNLKKENRNNILMVGNTVVDSLILCLRKIKNDPETYKIKFDSILDKEKCVLITGHRRENIGSGFENICEALVHLASSHPEIRFIYPVHLNPNVKGIVHERLSSIHNITLLEPLPYDELVFLMSKSHIILTDSGGIQEEAPTLGVPLLVMRDTSERPEGIDAGCALLVGTDTFTIISSFEKLYTDKEVYKQMSQVSNPYGDGQTSQRIAEHLSAQLN